MPTYTLSETTYARLMQMLADRDGGGIAPTRRPRAPVIAVVYCESATAAGGDDVGDMSYPGVITSANATDEAPADVTGCWLTVYGDDFAPAVPVEGRPYLCLVAGDIELDGETRQRAFGVAAEAGGGSSSSWKIPARVMATGNVTIATDLEDGDTLNGVTLATGDRVFLPFQSTAADNGIYVVPASGGASRAADAATGADLLGAVVFVSEGTDYADSVWRCVTDAPILTGVTATVWNRLDNPTTTKGDIVVHNGTEDVRHPVGTNGYVLMADSTAAAGVKWDTPATVITAGGGATWVKFTKTYLDFAVAAMSHNSTIFTLAPFDVIHCCVMRLTTRFSTGTPRSFPMTVGDANHSPTYWCSGLQTDQPVTGTTFASGVGGGTPTEGPLDFSGGVAVYAQVTNFAVNLDTLTQGEVDIWFLVSTLP